ncbi:uncharacterized protein LOC126267755 [Schistocerca gregaria]|uniref:uncharacterized protein LOC126267755 n=1 Tax=Schistocerca gregaria TaxID=7010 RepID=UPI00211ED241|nr:uncharacterized protein LOC126267755 [Schistocerca gregaria]
MYSDEIAVNRDLSDVKTSVGENVNQVLNNKVVELEEVECDVDVRSRAEVAKNDADVVMKEEGNSVRENNHSVQEDQAAVTWVNTSPVIKGIDRDDINIANEEKWLQEESFDKINLMAKGKSNVGMQGKIYESHSEIKEHFILMCECIPHHHHHHHHHHNHHHHCC